MLVEDCIIKRQTYSGLYFTNSNLTITGCKIEDNGSYVWSNRSGIYCSNSNLEVRRCIIQRNEKNGIWTEDASSPTILNNKICQNKYNGVFINHCEGIFIKNNWIYLNGDGSFYPNDGDYDSGVCLKNSISPAFIRNCTITKNASYGVYVALGQDPCLINDIIQQNGTGSSQDIFSENGIGGVYASYCCLENGFAGIGQDNIFCDPCFVNADINDFHLKPASLCIDAGDPYADYGDETDIDGQCRVAFGGTAELADIGGDEFAPKADYNKDSIVNFIDYAKFAAKWRMTDANISLDDNDIVNIYDLKLFCQSWLWHAPCFPLYEMLAEQSQGDSAMATSTELVEQTPAAETVEAPVIDASAVAEEATEGISEPVSDEQIQILIDWLEQIWQADPEIQDTMDPNDYQHFIDLLREEIND